MQGLEPLFMTSALPGEYVIGGFGALGGWCWAQWKRAQTLQDRKDRMAEMERAQREREAQRYVDLLERVLETTEAHTDAIRKATQ